MLHVSKDLASHLGAGLGVDTSLDNSLCDWSRDYTYYLRGLLDQSPLLFWSNRALGACTQTVRPVIDGAEGRRQAASPW